MLDTILDMVLPYKLMLVGCNLYKENEKDPFIQLLELEERYFSERKLLKKKSNYIESGEILKIGNIEGKTHYVLRNPLPEDGGNWKVEIPKCWQSYF